MTYEYQKFMQITFIETDEDGVVNEDTLSYDITNAPLSRLVTIFLNVLYYLTFTYVDDLVAETEDYDMSAYRGRIKRKNDQ